MGCHQAGKLGEAEALYRRILATQPRQPDALNLLGLLRYQRDDAAAALALFDQALAVGARVPDYHNNRGMALARLGRLDEAAASYRRALALRAGYPEAQYNLGNALRALGDARGACAAYRAAVAARPGMADAHMNLGNLLAQTGEAAAALAHLEKAAALKPKSAVAQINLAIALRRLDRFDAAAARLGQALALEPDAVEALYQLARVELKRGDLAAAEERCRAVLLRHPDHARARLALARTLLKARRAADALSECDTLTAARPDDAEAWFLRGRALEGVKNLSEAVRTYGHAVALDPAHRRATVQLATVQLAMGQVEAALAVLKPIMGTGSEVERIAASNYLMAQNYAPGLGAEALAESHRSVGGMLEAAVAPVGLAARDRDPERRLRIGYVSTDFRLHSCAFFFEPLLAAHDRAAVEVFCYAANHEADEVTARLRAGADGWRDIATLSDPAAAAQVQADAVDILVDLGGHTGENRLMLFAAKPAPVQASWLGYPNTTGFARIDYRLSDDRADPAGAEALYSETLMRLERPFLCYRPPDEAPAVADLPAAQDGAVTFGSFNNISKEGPQVISLWSAILHAVPGSRLLLKSSALADEGVRIRYRSLFAEHGIAPERIGLFPFALELRDALQTYATVDVALDPFPYNGTTTTCEALWMGVPVVTLEGDRHAARVGSSLLHAVGLDECVAASEQDYLDTAVALAGDLPRLAALRGSLRARVAASPLCDGAGFARAMEQAYRAMWRRWCAAGR